MFWIQGIWFALGLVLGFVHLTAVWRSANKPDAATTITGSVRLLIVGLALASTAIAGGILPSAVGWAVAFFGSAGVLITTRIRHRRAAP